MSHLGREEDGFIKFHEIKVVLIIQSFRWQSWRTNWYDNQYEWIFERQSDRERDGEY